MVYAAIAYQGKGSMKRHLALVLLVFYFFAWAAASQTTSTEILGRVTDPSGAVVPGAQVILLRLSTGERRETLTSRSGDYDFPVIEIGEYSVTVSKEGFKTAEQKPVLAQFEQKARVDFRLELGAVSDKIQVVARGVGLKTDDAAVGQVLDRRLVLELPLNGRNVASLAVLVPGVQYGTRQGFDGLGGFPIPGNMVALSANGQRDTNQQVTLDGVIATEPRVNTLVSTPSTDAIEEVTVQTSSYSAEYGQNNGAVLQIALRSGTGRLRGTVYEFLRNEALDARDYFLNFQLPPGARPAAKNRLRQNQFGGFLAGPVIVPGIYDGKRRTFWSFNYEGRRVTQESVREGFWFPEPFRNGDFSALLRPLIRNGQPVRAPIIIFDPLTGEPFRDASGNITNIIPAARIHRNAQAFLNRFQPLPPFQPEDILDINVRGSVPDRSRTNQYFFRVDHQLSQRQKVFVRYAADHSRRTQSDLNPNFPVFTIARAANLAVQHIYVLGGHTLNEFRYGLDKADDESANPRTNTDFDLDSLGIGQFRVAVDHNRKLSPQEVGIPSTIAGLDRDPGGFDFNTVHQFTDNIAVSRSKHTVKAGFEYRRVSLDRTASNQPRGSFGGSVQAGFSLAGWLLGFPGASTTPEGLPFTAPRQNRWGAYLLDDWKATRHVTLNLGLRWDFFQVPVDANGAWRSLRLDILSQASDGRLLPTLVPAPNTKNFALYQTDNRYFMPRVGLAWRVTEKWVVRSGGGWYVNAQQLNNFTILALQPPRSGSFTFTQVTDPAETIRYEYAGQVYNIQTQRFRPGSQILTLDNLFPGAGTAPARTNLLLMPPDNKYSSHVQWSLDVQRSLPWNSLLTIAYVGSKTSHLDNNVANFNSPDPSPNTDVNGRRPWQAYASEGEGSAPHALGSIRYLDSYGNGSYHGLQTSLEKRYSHGLLLGLAYVYSKAQGEGYDRNTGTAAGGGQNPRDRRSDRSRYGFDVTHNAVIHYVYEMPFLNRFKGPAGPLLRGWQTNGIITLRTGFPFDVNVGNLNTGGGARPDRVADGRLGSRATRQRWFDPTAFRRTDCNIPSRLDLCHYGNAGDGILLSPGARNFDLSLARNWGLRSLGEAGRLQLRAEFFNAFNTPQFGQPNGLTFSSLSSIVPDGPRDGEIRGLRLPMRIIQFGLKLYF